MNNKKFWAISFICFAIVYTFFININNSHELTGSDSNATTPQSSSQACLPSDKCNESPQRHIEVTKPVTPLGSITTTVPTVMPPATVKIDASITVQTSAPDVLHPLTSPIKLQGKEVIKESSFLSQDIHQCRIEFDKQSVDKINHIIEQVSYEIDLNKSTYKVNNDLQLNVISPTLPERFNENLVYKIQTLLQIYRQTFGLNLHKKSEINLVILPSQQSYQDFIANLSLDSTNTQGLFWARSNYAFVAFKNIEQAEETAFHESVHAINFSLVGVQSRWLNEGLAEVFEKMKVTQENGNPVVSLKLAQLTGHVAPMGYQDLVYAEQQWWDFNQVSGLYSSSLYFTSYLFDHKQGVDIIGELLVEEGKNPCQALTMDQYLQIINENIFNLPATFDDWLTPSIS